MIAARRIIGTPHRHHARSPLAPRLRQAQIRGEPGIPAAKVLPMPDVPLPAAEIAETPAPAGLRIGHVHLKVAEIERGLGFWRDVIGLEEQARYGDQAVFLSAGGYHHHIALNTWESAGGDPPPRSATGLYHVALLYPDRLSLARALRRLKAHGIALEGASDHGVSEALYLRDPDGNGVELYRDRDPADWPRDQAGRLAMYTRRLDLDALLAEA
jgi:catechol 2,3-dioxygenase